MCREWGAIFGGQGDYASLMLTKSWFKVFGQSYICLGIFTPLRCYCDLIDYPMLVACPWAGLHKLKQCLQEFFNFFCACWKNHYLVFSHAALIVIFTCFHALLYLLYSFLSVYLPSNVSFTTSNDYFGHCAWQTKDVLQENLADCTDCGGLNRGVNLKA